MREIEIGRGERGIDLLQADDELQTKALEVELMADRGDVAFERGAARGRRAPRASAKAGQLLLVVAYGGFERRSSLGAGTPGGLPEVVVAPECSRSAVSARAPSKAR
jgi:hypothetical protein